MFSLALYASSIYVAVKHPEQWELAAGLAAAGVVMDVVETLHDIRGQLARPAFAPPFVPEYAPVRRPCGCGGAKHADAPPSSPPIEVAATA